MTQPVRRMRTRTRVVLVPADVRWSCCSIYFNPVRGMRELGGVKQQELLLIVNYIIVTS